MKEKIDSIVKSLNDKIHPDLTLNDLEALRVEYLGKKWYFNISNVSN